MVRGLRQLTDEALQLPAEDRLALVAELIDSVEGRPDPEWEAAWLAELEARRDRGKSDARTWAQIRKRILGRLSSGR